MKRNKRILFHIDSLWGVGHFVRSSKIIAKLSKKYECHVISSAPFKNYLNLNEVEFYELPRMEYKDDYSSLNTECGEKQQVLDVRFDICVRNFIRIRPHILFIELFPYGRHSLWQEAMALLELSRENQCKIISSLRDIYIYPTSEQYYSNISNIIDRFKILTLIHTDIGYINKNYSLPANENRKGTILATGFVGKPEIEGSYAENGILLCLTGGGKKGKEIVTTAISLLNSDEKLTKSVIYLNSYLDSKEANIKELISQSNKEVELRSFDSQFYLSKIPECQGVICSGGYNTLMDVIQSQCPCLVQGIDEEQKLRAKLFSKNVPWINDIEYDFPPSDYLKLKWQETVTNRHLPFNAVDVNGASKCLEIIDSFYENTYPYTCISY